MKKLFYILTLVMVMMLGCLTAHADFPERPVGLVVLDYGRNVDTVCYKQNIYAPVRWAYHFPFYKIHDDENLTNSVADVLQGNVKVTPALMRELAEKNKMDVLVVAKVYELSEVMVSTGMGWRHDPGLYTRVTCWADLYCYRVDKDKLLTKKLRERFLSEGGYERPQDTIKWQLSKLVNTMEGRPIIGGDN